MGLMDKLKAVKSNLTGDWADVQVSFEPVARGAKLSVTADVTVKNEAISIDGVVVEVRCTERIDIPSATIYEGNGSLSSGSSRRATSDETTFTTEVKAGGPQELASGSSTTFTAEVLIPTSEPPTSQGRYARYEWEVRARLEMKGNDPDSGWQTVQVG